MRFGKPSKTNKKIDARYFLNESATVHNNSNKNMNDVQFYFEEFYPFAKEALGFDKDATVVFESDLANAKNPLGKTAHYDPSNSTVTVYVDKRHPKDVLRSISHELVHHAQNLRGDLNAGAMEEGYAQEDDHLRKMEEEAYRKGNMVFRDWTDTRNNPEGQKNIMSRLMQEWGYDEQALELDENLNFEEGQLVVVVASALAVDGEKTGTVVNSDDKSVTIKLDDDQEGKYVPDDRVVKVRKDYVEPRAEAGFDDVMGETEEVNEMYDDDFDMDSLEDEFPWLKKDMGAKKGAPPADVAADLDAEFGDMMAAHQDEEEEEEITVMKEGGSMAEYGKIDAEDGNPPSKIGRGNEEYMEAYNAVLVARGEDPLDIQQPDQAYLDALHGGRLEEGFRFSDEEKAMLDKMSKKEFSDYVTKGRHTTPDLKGDMGEIPGMEGPFQYKSGAVLYYDTKTGEYYDRGQDRYLDRDEAAELTMEGLGVDGREFNVGDMIQVTGGGLKGATGEIIEFAEGKAVVRLETDADQRVFGQATDEVIVRSDHLAPMGGMSERKGVDRKKAAWMKAYDDAAGNPQPKPRDFWDTATFLYNKGEDPVEAGQRYSANNMNEMEGDGDGWGEVHGNAADEAPTRDAAANSLRKLDKTIASYLKSADRNPQYETDARDLQDIRDMFASELEGGASPGNFSDGLKNTVSYLDTIVRDEIPQDMYYSIFPNLLENKKMKLEEMVRQAVRKALTEKKNYRREDEKEEEKDNLEEGNQESRTITQIEKIGDEVSSVMHMNADPAVADKLQLIDEMITALVGQMQGVEPMGMEEAESTEKYDDDPALKGDQDELPDHLQKAIIDDEEENVDEETNKEWYDSQLFENLMKKWAK